MAIEITHLEFRPVNIKGKKMLAGVTVTFNDVLEIQCVIHDSANGPFFAFPRHKGKDGKWYNQVYLNDKNLLAIINDRIIQSFSAWRNQPKEISKMGYQYLREKKVKGGLIRRRDDGYYERPVPKGGWDEMSLDRGYDPEKSGDYLKVDNPEIVAKSLFKARDEKSFVELSFITAPQGQKKIQIKAKPIQRLDGEGQWKAELEDGETLLFYEDNVVKVG